MNRPFDELRQQIQSDPVRAARLDAATAEVRATARATAREQEASCRCYSSCECCCVCAEDIPEGTE